MNAKWWVIALVAIGAFAIRVEVLLRQNQFRVDLMKSDLAALKQEVVNLRSQFNETRPEIEDRLKSVEKSLETTQKHLMELILLIKEFIERGIRV